MDVDHSRYLDGELLYGDDLTEAEIAEWHEDEREGYSGLVAGDERPYRYEYHAMDAYHGFRYLPQVRFERAMGLGSAYADEFLPLASRLGSLTIVEPSSAFVRDELDGVRVTYVPPVPDGTLPFDDASFDLVTCLSVLHHIPNVTHVFGELARVLAPGGYLLLREPIVSMGDWRQSRRGLTAHERGIPLPILRGIVERSGLRIVHESLCVFSLTSHLFRPFGLRPYDRGWSTGLDALVSRAFAWNVNYHPRNLLQRFRPTSVYAVMRKPSALGE